MDRTFTQILGQLDGIENELSEIFDRRLPAITDRHELNSRETREELDEMWDLIRGLHDAVHAITRRLAEIEQAPARWS